MADLHITDEHMKTHINNLKTQLGVFKSTTTNMTKTVNALCNGWKAKSSETYRQDYQKLTSNFTKTSGVVEELIKSTEQYLEDMNQLDVAYSKSKVNNA